MILAEGSAWDSSGTNPSAKISDFSLQVSSSLQYDYNQFRMEEAALEQWLDQIFGCLKGRILLEEPIFQVLLKPLGPRSLYTRLLLSLKESISFVHLRAVIDRGWSATTLS